MSLPAGSGASFAVQLEFLLKNEDTIARIQKETDGIADAYERAQAQIKLVEKEIDKALPGLRAQAKAERAAAEAAKKHSTEIRLQIMDIRAQVREIAELILKSQGKWQGLVELYHG